MLQNIVAYWIAVAINGSVYQHKSLLHHLLKMSFCGHHFSVQTFFGFPGNVSASHFQRICCGSSENACRKASLLSSGNVLAWSTEPRLKYITPWAAPSKYSCRCWNYMNNMISCYRITFHVHSTQSFCVANKNWLLIYVY